MQRGRQRRLTADAFAGAVVVVIASGPSLTVDDCETVREWRGAGAARRVVVVNTSFQRAPWADALYACDHGWWKTWFQRASFATSSEFWTIDRRAAQEFGLRLVALAACGGHGGRPGAIRHWRNSGFQAVQLALQAGAARVVLLGFDMKFTAEGRKHWHADHAGRNPAARSFKGWIAGFDALAAAAPVPIVNASADTALACFPRMPLAAALSA